MARLLRVRLGRASYPILLEFGVLGRLGRRLRETGFVAGPVALVSDRRVERLYGRAARASLARAGFTPHCFSFPPGERSKNLATVQQIYAAWARAGLERGRPVVALGGGVVGDVAGFAAATWLRGLPLVQVPTSLLAQLDSSVGGKVGVDLPAGKNLVGAFHQPSIVAIDPTVLATLPPRHVRSGLAEAVKVGFALDRGLVALLERGAESLLRRDPHVLAAVIERALRAKIRLVERDEREAGPRQLLNYGHTVGHAL